MEHYIVNVTVTFVLALAEISTSLPAVGISGIFEGEESQSNR